MLTIDQRLSYGLGDFGINLYFMSVMSYLLFFYTEVYGISASVAAGVFFVARLVDAIFDPLMGYLADRTRSRWGRFRPYLFWGPIPLALITVATFTVPDFDEFGKVLWAYLTYTAFGIIYTVVTIPYAGMTSVLTDNHQERATLSTVRMACAFSGGILVSTFLPSFVEWFGGNARGYQNTMSLFAVVATLLLWITFARTRERISAQTLKNLRITDSVRVIGRNPPLGVVMLLFTFGMLAFTFRQAAAPYHFTYNVQRPDLIGDYFGVTLGVMTLSLVVIPYLTRRFDKAGAIRIGAMVALVGGCGFYLTPPDDIFWTFVWGSVLAVGGAPVAVLCWAMIPDTIEYAQLRTGIRADGVVFATASFFQKLAKAIGGAGVAALLAWFGYVANQPQTVEAKEGILLMMSVCPLVVNVLLFLVSFFYRLDSRAHAEIVAALKAKNHLSVDP